MHILLVIYMLFGISFLGSAKFHKKFEEFLPVTAFSIILVSYIFGFFNCLKYNIYFLFICTTLAYLWGLYTIIKRKSFKEFSHNFFSPGFVFFFIFLFAIILYNSDRYLESWDEFSHWGAVVKNMFYTNAFSVSESSFLQFRSYPPGISLFLYDIQLIVGSYAEPYLFIGSKIFIFMQITYFFKFFEWKEIKKATIFGFIMIILPVIFFPNFYSTVLIDECLAITASFIILYIIFNKHDYMYWINIMFGSMTLILLKDSGAAFVVICILILLIKLFLLDNKKAPFLKLMKQYWKSLLLLVLMILITLFSWKYLIKINNVAVQFSDPVNINDFVSVILGSGSNHHIDVLTNFINAIFNVKLIAIFGANICTIHIVAFFIVIMYLNRRNKNVLYVLNCLLCSYCVYLFGLLGMYMFKFSEYEALNLASFLRYNNTFVFLLFIVAIILFLYKNNIKYYFYTFIICLLFSPLGTPIENYYKKNNTYKERLPYINAKKDVMSLVKDPSTFIFVVQNDSGRSWQILNYEFMEISSGASSGWSYGEPYYDGDIWTNVMTQNEFKDYLQNYDYVFLFKIDEKFISNYGSLFENQDIIMNNQLYKVDEDSGGLVLVK